MNPIAEEIMSYYGYAESLNDELKHYGTKRHSGRYPWGSGEEPYQRGIDFLGRYETLKKAGMSDTDIAKELNMLNDKGEPSTGILRLEKKWASDMRRIDQMQTARSLKEDGLGATEIGRRMGISESTVRSLLDPGAAARTMLATNTANFLRDQCDKKGMIDVGVDVERELSGMDLTSYDICRSLNISKDRLNEALYILKKEGYEVYGGRFDQVNNPGKMTTQKVLCPPGTKKSEIYNLDQIHTISDYTSSDGGKTFQKFQYPASLDSKRLKILLHDEIGPDGEPGVAKDGLIQIRPGVKDLSLGDAKYSQVRILVDDNKYLKGMAVYSDNMPDGVDVIFNTNKTSYDKALKDIKTDDPTNPFGSLIKSQSYYDDPNGKYTIDGVKKSLSLINKRADEGDWSDWTDSLPSQFLSKQAVPMAKKQLDIAKADKLAEFDDIMSLNNGTVKKHLLDKFADSCDSAAVHLKAAALPGQKYHVMIPINTLKDNEVYCPKYKDGTKLALIRYPHAGTFEIPIVTVNNKHKQAIALLGKDNTDAIGVTKKVADRLSGADFDGDTVMCIPTHDRQGRVKVTSTKELDDLKGFDPQMAYPERPGMKYMKDPITGKDATQTEMGKISNLISDMTLLDAPPEDMAKAVKHSMVVIDAAKHKLDYTRSYVENDIARLKKEYQRHVDTDGNLIKTGGAATIISKASGEYTVNKRQGTPKVNMPDKEWYDPNRPVGSLIYKDADDLYYPVRSYNKETGLTTLRTVDGKKITYDRKDPVAREMYDPIDSKEAKAGKVPFTNKDGTIEYRRKARTQPSTNMAETDDAMTLISPMKHPMELTYAEFANSMKALANQARKESMTTKEIEYDSNAKRIYQAEVDSLNEKLNTALLNSPRERAAQRKANVEKAAYKAANPNAKNGDLKKKGQQALSAARDELNAIARRDRSIEITDKEWEAIQAGAISKTQLKKILNNTDVDVIREKATPKTTKTLSDAKVNRIKAMSATYTIQQIADKFNVSPSTVSSILKGGN